MIPSVAAPRSPSARAAGPSMPFSRAVDGVEEAMSIKFNNLIYDLERQGKRVLVMSLGEAFFDIPLFPMEELPFPQIYHYSHSRGIFELRAKLAAYAGREYGLAIDPDNEILITAGAKAAIHFALMAILNPGDEVLIPEPAWVSYTEQVKLCHAVPVTAPLGTSTFELERLITKRTRAIIINTPHNPTGYIYTRAELEHLLELAERHGLWILSDEAYSDFVLPGDRFVSLGSLDPAKARSIVVNSMSKNYGMSGWRVGYVAGRADLIYRVLKVNQHLITCPATILQLYLARHFERILEITKPQIHAVCRRRNALQAYAAELGMHSLPGSATFYFFLSIEPSRLDSVAFCTQLLLDHQVSAVPGIGYGRSCDRHIRVSVGTASDEESRRGLDTIRRLIDRTR